MYKKLSFLIAIVSMAVLAGLPAHHALALTAGFQKTVIAQGFTAPVALAQAPDGRIFVLEKTGQVKIIKNGTLLPQPFLNLSVNTDGERGLLGIAFDPQFTTNNYIYLYYVNASPLEIHVSRFTANGDVADPASELILLRSTQTLGLIHHSGTLRFGPDGKLWMTVGNNGDNSNSQNLSNIHGKVLRINKDGTIPSDNPFYNIPGVRGEIWAYGFRNPFRFNFLPDGRPILGDVGEASVEEINIIEKSGNYGWPNSEGPCSNCSSINPLLSYPHNGLSAAVTGGVFYTGTAFPTQYQNSYFYGDYAKGFVHQLALDNGYDPISDNSIDDAAGSVVDFMQGQDGNIYYVTIFPGKVYELSHTNQNIAPGANIAVDQSAGLAPLTVNFSSTGSSDPEGASLSYAWAFGDGATSTLANPSHTYIASGSFNTTLTVNDGQLNSTPATITITSGKQLPLPVMDTPLATDTYNAGQTISYSGHATDAQDGTLPASAFSWTMIFHHQTHIHPFLGPINGVQSGTFVIPNTGENSTETWYEIQLTVTNSFGLKKTITRNIYPNTATLTFTSSAPGTQFTLDGIPHTFPYSVGGVSGFLRTIDTATPQLQGSTSYNFTNWSDGGARSHQITTPANDTTYSATFSQTSGYGSLRLRIEEFNTAGNLSGNFVNGATVKITDPTGNTVFNTSFSAPIGNQDGWVALDNLPVGNYGLLVYKPGYKGYWEMTDCAGHSTTTGITITNGNTQSYVAVQRTDIAINPGQTTWCKDVGLRVSLGNLAVRIRTMERTATGYTASLDSNAGTIGINGASVLLTDSTGNVLQRASSSAAGTDGWAFFNNQPTGTYGLLAYKPGMAGVWKFDCNVGPSGASSSFQGPITNNQVAASNAQVNIIGGTTSYCYGLGLVGYGSTRIRVEAFNTAGAWTGDYINGATVKLTDPTGNTVYTTTTSLKSGTQDGWVFLENIPAGDYGLTVYKAGYKGYWKMTDCSSHSTTTGVGATNTNTEGQIAATRNDITITAGNITWCKDMGLQTLQQPGQIYFRIPGVSTTNGWDGTYINGASIKLTDLTGTNIFATASSSMSGTQDGWIFLNNIASGSYGIMAYKPGYTGFWRQGDCTGTRTTDNATIQNANSNSLVAGWQPNAPVISGQTTWCMNIGLKPISQ